MSYYYIHDEKKSDIFEDLDDLFKEILFLSLSSLVNHSLKNYYIYDDKSLFYIIKSSQIDPLSGNYHNWCEEQKEIGFWTVLDEREDDIEDELDRLKSLMIGRQRKVKDYENSRHIFENIENFRNYIKTSKVIEQKLKGRNDISEVIKMSYQEMNVINNYGFRFLHSHMPQIFIQDLIDCTNKGNTKEEIEKYVAKQCFEDMQEDCAYSFLFYEKKLFGIFRIPKACSWKMNIEADYVLKAILLTGADSFKIYKNFEGNDSKNTLEYFSDLLEIDFLGIYEV